MKRYQRRVSRYTRRMVEDMQLRNMADSTINAYVYQVEAFCRFFDMPADQLGPKDIREYQLFLVNEKRVSWSTFNQFVSGLRFLYGVTLKCPWEVEQIPCAKRPRKLPVVLSSEEAARLFACLHFPKHRAILLTCYAAGLRLAEAINLRIADIDGDRGQLHIKNGKGGKDRYVPAAPRLLNELRNYWKLDRPHDYLFPGKDGELPLSPSHVRKVCKRAASKAGIHKTVTPHVLRHSYATSMLEAGVDLLTISRILGHSSFETTVVYLHVRREHLGRIPSPIDWMPPRQFPDWIESANCDT